MLQLGFFTSSTREKSSNPLGRWLAGPEDDKMKTQERRKLQILFNVMDVLIDNTSESMPLRQALSLLSVAIRESQEGSADLRDVGRDTGANSAVVSRDLLGLGKRSRTGKPGLGLISAEEDYTDLRRKPYKLTPHGKTVMRKLLEVL